MPFRSKRQWRAAMSGRIEGISKSDAHDWAHETSTPFKDLPDRAPAEKGKPTLRSKKADYLDDKEARRRRQGTKHASAFEPLEQELAEVFKAAAFKMPEKGKGLRRVGELLTGSHRRALDKEWKGSFGGKGNVIEIGSARKAKAFNKERKVETSKIRGARAAALVAGGIGAQDFVRGSGDKRKSASLGTAVSNPNNVGKLKGMMSTHALKAPGYAAATQAMNPRKNVVAAMNKIKPH
jgi:hypothetical protein